MTTINISLPEKQAQIIDFLVTNYGFESRSEFFRTILRRVLIDCKLLKKTITYPFISPKTKSRKKIIEEFKKTGKYSNYFLTDLKEGLKNSDYFENV